MVFTFFKVVLSTLKHNITNHQQTKYDIYYRLKVFSKYELFIKG